MKLTLAFLTLASGVTVAHAQSSLWTNPRGLPSGEQWIQRIDDRTSSTFRVYQIGENGPIVSFNPQTSEVVKNPVNGVYEAVIQEDSVSGKAEGESSSSIDPVWPTETGEITLNSDIGELARNADGQYEAVINESAFSGEGLKERVPGGQATEPVKPATVKLAATPAPTKPRTSSSNRSAVGTYRLYRVEPPNRAISRPTQIDDTLNFSSDGSFSEKRLMFNGSFWTPTGRWQQNGNKITYTYTDPRSGINYEDTVIFEGNCIRNGDGEVFVKQ